MKLPHNDYKILIVDSSLMIAERLNSLLQEMDCSNCVTTAATYPEALEKLSLNDYNIVLLDTQLPGKNGFELLSFIKANYPQTKTVLFTNQVSDFYRNKGKRIGTDHFLDKSGEFEKVIEIIKEYSVGYQMN